MKAGTNNEEKVRINYNTQKVIDDFLNFLCNTSVALSNLTSPTSLQVPIIPWVTVFGALLPSSGFKETLHD